MWICGKAKHPVSEEEVIKLAGLDGKAGKDGFMGLRSDDISTFLENLSTSSAGVNFCIKEYTSDDPAPAGCEIKGGDPVECRLVRYHYTRGAREDDRCFAMVCSRQEYHWWAFRAFDHSKFMRLGDENERLRKTINEYKSRIEELESR
jgi:hypothetical protein